jgi:hypothetical protein
LNLKAGAKNNREGLMSGRSWRLLQLTAVCGVSFGALTVGAHAQSAGSWVMKAPVPASLS